MGRRRVWDGRAGVALAIAGVVGELMVTVGLLTLLFVVYLLWGTGVQTAAAQRDLREQLIADDMPAVDETPVAGTPGAGETPRSEETPSLQDDASASSELEDVGLGDAYGIIRIPRFGADWEWVIVQGVDDQHLKDGPGHYPDSADPGELGNFSVAGHRSGHGEPFADFPDLRTGDLVEVVTAEGTFTYRLDDAPNGDSNGNKIEISETWVVDPVPGEPANTEPAERRLTLTTCWPRLGSSARMYATGTLVSGRAG